MAENLILCYHKGCGKQFDPSQNLPESCKYHPGVPVFHDALKGWSCCKKRSTDFTEFLNIPGCTTGKHSNTKPIEPETKKETEQPKDKKEVVIVKAHLPEKPEELAERPSENEPMIRLKSIVGATLKQALEKQMQNVSLNDKEVAQECISTSENINIGESCKNNGCKKSYEGPHSISEDCTYHPGVPVFHEGMKFWSCCQRKTSEFSNFLEQEGCANGPHVWFKKENKENKVACRYDWHQTGPHVTISVFSKLAVPEKSWVEANRVSVKIFITFDGGKSVFDKQIILRKVIDPSQSSVKLLGAKVEINLKKAEPGSWPTLEQPLQNPATQSNDDEDAIE